MRELSLSDNRQIFTLFFHMIAGFVWIMILVFKKNIEMIEAQGLQQKVVEVVVIMNILPWYVRRSDFIAISMGPKTVLQDISLVHTLLWNILLATN